ncbi:AAA family ATPase [Pedobacter sp. UC225_61]|uniref:AAA family ATPase n=1 Tax=Pedobacter sp. UC225_61 TaxID=3374623 RepID=UPI003795C9BE
MTKEERLAELEKVFSPTAPIKEQSLFSGRFNQLKKTAEAINQVGQHAIVYGERGVGKTSLANTMTYTLTNIYPVKVTCNRKDTFATLWSKIFRKISQSITTSGVGFRPIEKHIEISLDSIIDFESKNVQSEIEAILEEYAPKKFLFIFDEFDNILDSETRESFADLIKSFSDNVTNTTIVLVGIADTIDTLIGSHQSLERCLRQIKMPRMSDPESEHIIEHGLNCLDISISKEVKSKIVEFSSGFPHYIHLLCKYGAEEIIMNDHTDFTEAYLRIAINKGIENTNEQLISAYRKAVVGSSATIKWQNVLFACAEAPLDEFNCFSLSDIIDQYNQITSMDRKAGTIAYNLKQICQEERGSILQKLDKGIIVRYRFSNPMMRAFIKLKINSDYQL